MSIDNSFGSLEILDSTFEIADHKKFYYTRKFCVDNCTEMKLCLIECSALVQVKWRF